MQQERVRVKICGITRLEDALAAVDAGADALGFVFYPDSPRAISASTAADICKRVPPFVCKVGLFVNSERDKIIEILEQVALDLLQFHGDESPDHCDGYSKPYIKAVRMHDNVNLVAEAKRFKQASALLLDAFVKGIYGGTGRAFDWTEAAQNIGKPVILAGGLTADNVVTAIKQVRPYAVDVSGGVESGRGIKDAGKILEFIREVRNA
ncbi:MAG: phosphoribosylanthranilate isomerase [Gammaproteobacteria bacterium]|nr:phosphoribosylanthranilate isomerase [Gammaproteobacteria bacterium]NIN61360.1 phosphoribosylanthranilate isomerase [Gammaproteobacteria bacterium]NIO61127.1 phosphoribosylanthranilate isomerase [Gammaproteobacteria bacterium]NIP48939.1 phosphoribosylanthranilate isomerase [Gammaproteobacteria bacterium]NIQ09393.1 phosphoribosylanthranilate isomerase [Gammaproteobacteria bacterium]